MRLLPLLMLAFFGCHKDASVAAARADAAAAPNAAQTAEGVRSVVWQLDWDKAGITLDPAGWRTLSDTGYDVRVTTGTLTTWRLGLQPCPKTTWSLIPSAYAHHIEPPDPTSVLPHLVENLAAPVATRLPVRQVPPDRYCRGFWLVSPPPPALAGEGPRVSLALHATWTRGDDHGELALDTWIPDSKLQTVPGLQEATGDVELKVERHLKTLFDGIDLANAPTPALAWTVLHRLMETTDWDAHALQP